MKEEDKEKEGRKWTKLRHGKQGENGGASERDKTGEQETEQMKGI